MLLAGCPDAGKQIEPAVKPEKPVVPEKPAHSFSFGVESHKAQYKAGGTYTGVVVETNKPRGDKRAITYASSDNRIATVDNKGVVTFVNWGKVTITATKTAEAGLPRATASYILTIASDFAFGEATVGSRKVAFTANTYSLTVDNTNKPAGDARDITYASSNEKIATVGAAGEVTFLTPGTVTITATKVAEAGHEEAVASYILYITMKPATKADLVAEITRAMNEHGNEVDLNYIDTSAITNMRWLFGSYGKSGYGLNKFDGDISKWDVSNVTDTSRMFVSAASFNGDISEWDVSQVTTMQSMFYGAKAFNQNISEWKTSKVTNMKAMFYDANVFNGDISKWDVSKVTNMKAMFEYAHMFNSNISGWDVSKVTNMQQMFHDARVFNQDISRWKVSKVTNMSYMFSEAKAFKHNLDAWGERLNPAIRANSDHNTFNIFVFSGLVSNLPSWCRIAGECTGAQ